MPLVASPPPARDVVAFSEVFGDDMLRVDDWLGPPDLLTEVSGCPPFASVYDIRAAPARSC